MKTTGVLALVTCVLALSFAACARSETAPKAAAKPDAPSAPSTPGNAAPPAALAGSDWLVEEIAGGEIVDNARVSIRFEPTGRVSGNTGLNNFTCTATFSGQNLAFGPIASTRRGGPEALMTQEQRFHAALGSTATWNIDDHRQLRLQTAAGEALLRCSPMPAGAADNSGSAAAGK